MASPTNDEVFNDFVAINKIAINSLHELGKVRVKSMTEEDLRKLVLATSKAILCRLPCLRLGDPVIGSMHSEYFRILADKMGAA